MELDQFKDVCLVIDKANDVFIQRQFVSQGDYKGRSLTVQVTNNGNVGEVPGLTLNLNWHNEASGLTDLTAFTILDKTNSIFRIEYPENMMTPGKVYASIQIIQDGKVTNLKQFELIVQKLAGQPVGIVEKAEFSALVAVLADSNKFRTDIDNLSASKADKTYINYYLSKVTAVPETFTNLDAIKAKYPSGKNGVMVAADNGHKYIWANNVWTDAGVYQSAGIADSSISTGKIKSLNGDQVSLNEFYDINPIPWQDRTKALTMSFDPSSAYFSATTATTQPNSGMLFQAKRKAGSYTLNFWGVNSNMSGQGVYLADANGNIKQKFGNYFANVTNDSETIKIGASSFELYGIKVGDTFQILISIGTSEAGGKNISGYVQLSNDSSIKKNTNLNSEIDKINLKFQQSLYRQNAIIDTKMTRWFSDANYTLNNDGSITYWRNGKNNPGPYYLLTQPVITGETTYVCFEAKKITGELTGVEIQFCNNNVFSNPALGFRLADTVAVRLSNEFEQYIVPIVLDPKWSQQDPSTAGVLISISSSVDQAKMIIKNVAIIHAGSDDIDLGLKTAQSVQAEEAVLTELSSGRRKGELLNLDVSESPLTKVHYVSPKSVVSSDNMYLDSLTVNLKTAETVRFAIGSVDQNSLMIKSSDFTLSLPAGTRTIVFKEDIAIPAGSRLFMECHNQGILYQSATSTEKILVEDEDHQINTNGYSGYALYESTLMSPFSYRVRGRSVYEIANDAKSLSDANADTNEELKRSVNILTSPTGKKFAISVGDDGTISTTPMTPNKALFYGNSLTIGLDNYGMAASDYKHGWADLVSQAIKKVNPSFTYQSINGGYWENATTSADRIAELNNTVKPNIDASVDLVVIQLSDNVNTDEKKATFDNDAKAIITWFRQQAPKARIVWIASWFNPPLIPAIAEACKERGALLCDIEQYARPQQYKSYVGAVWTDRQGVKHTIDSAGRANHPGDLGMKMIAESVERTLGLI